MVDKYLRSPKEHCLAWLARRLEHILPLHITLTAFAVGLLAVWFTALGHYGEALALWLVNRMLDGLDGDVARYWKKQSDLGGYLDIICDFIIYALLPLAMALSRGSSLDYLSVGLLLGTFYLNSASWMYLAAVLEKRGRGAHYNAETTSVTMPAGLIEGAETILFYCAFLVFPAAFAWLCLAMAGLVIITIAQRVHWAARHL